MLQRTYYTVHVSVSTYHTQVDIMILNIEYTKYSYSDNKIREKRKQIHRKKVVMVAEKRKLISKCNHMGLHVWMVM